MMSESETARGGAGQSFGYCLGIGSTQRFEDGVIIIILSCLYVLAIP